ncbi:acyltransferase family protein [Mitsuaria sp. 7]|uniref:acyltransferase family protein n=1 Tax=Mitsuaria sp. 7 TaxID=1658665 RepID=UPI00082C943F|nr:acyltransferase [Mitsuaria sp. 7]
MTTARLPSPDAARSDWVDIAKGFGILLVVYGHVARGLVNGGVAMDPWWFTTLDSAIYSFHMPLFFLLSGWFFVGSLTRRGPRDYLAGRVATVLYPYVLWSLLQGGIELLMSRWTSKPVTLAEVLALGWTPRAQFWFLYALFLMSVLAVVMCWRRPKAGVAALTLTGAVLMALQQRDWPMPAALVSSHLLYFAAGAWLGARGFGVATAWRLALTGVFVGGVAFAALQAGSIGEAKLLRLAAATLGLSAVCVLSIALATGGHGQRMAALGRASMAIFLAHILVASGARIVLTKGFGITTPWPHLIVGVAAGTLLPWWFWRAAQGRAAMALFELPAVWRRRLAGTGAPRRDAAVIPS